jgi:purine nucleosidase
LGNVSLDFLRVPLCPLWFLVLIFMARVRHRSHLRLRLRLQDCTIQKVDSVVEHPTYFVLTSLRPVHRIVKHIAILLCTVCSLLLFARTAISQGTASNAAEKIIIDTDIGDDVDDAFAVALALRSPELQILGISTTFGDTETRAKLADRLLGEVGREEIPVAVGTPGQERGQFTQRTYAEGGHFARASHPKAVDFILEQIRRAPGQVTLVAIGPLVNVGALIDKDADTFRKLRRVVLMGGSINRRYGDLGYFPDRGPEPEWNIKNDIPSAQKLFASGVPIFMMPLDSTQLKLDEVKREILFRAGTPLTDALTLLYHEWGQQTPTLFDVMTIAYILNPQLCPVKPMRIRVDEHGFTRSENGAPNAQVCLDSDPEAFFRFYVPRVAER